jgi:hypothetical protein
MGDKLGGENPLGPGSENHWRNARVSIVRWNLKEAGGKIPARCHIRLNGVDEFAKQNEVQHCFELHIVDAAGIWDEGYRSYPGRSGR